MKRVDFLLGVTPSDVVLDPITHRQMRVLLNNRRLGGVVAMKLEVDLTYGYMKAYIKRWRIGPQRSGARVDGFEEDEVGQIESVMGATGYEIILDQSGRFEYEEINPKMESECLVVESIIQKNQYTDFNLRTIIKESR